MEAIFDMHIKHGAAMWSDFYEEPPSDDALAWCSDPAIWREAITHRTEYREEVDRVWYPENLELLKTRIVDHRWGMAFVTNSPTGSDSAWRTRTILDDPSTPEDDDYVGQKGTYYIRERTSGHWLAIVGYNDDIWIDVNGNGDIDEGEKGALKIADSHTFNGNNGFHWLAYDALRPTSAVSGGPSSDRDPAFRNNERVYYVRHRESPYTPKLLAQFTLQTAARGDVRINFYRASVNDSPPFSNREATWQGEVFSKIYRDRPNRLGFDGNNYSSNPASAPEVTFVFDLTDIAPETDDASFEWRYVLAVTDTVAGMPVTVSSFKVIDPAAGDAESAAANVPITVDKGDQGFVWADYTMGATSAPAITLLGDNPLSLEVGTPYVEPGYTATDAEDGDITANVLVTGSVDHTVLGAYTLRYNVSDSSGNPAEERIRIVNVVDTTPPSTPVGLAATAVSATEINLTWNASTDNVGVAAYNIYRDGGKADTAATTSYSDTGLTPETTYTYTISACDASGNESSPSTAMSEQTLEEPNHAPVFLGGAAENIALNKTVTASRSDYTTALQMAVDGGGEEGNSWVATGAPNWAVVDLGQDVSINRIKVNPFNVSNTVYYYDDAWNIKYALSSDPDVWLDFAEVVKNAGGGNLVGEGVRVENGDPGSPDRDPAFLSYDFSFTIVQARYVRFECTIGDEDNDTNLNEIEVYTAGGGIPDQSPMAASTLHNVFDLDDYFTDPDGDTLTYSASGGVNVAVEINSDNAASLVSPPGWSGEETITFTAADGEGGEATSNGVVVVVVAPPLPGRPGKPIHIDSPGREKTYPDTGKGTN